MRLAQLARKLSVKPSEIVQFLATHAILVEDTANAKVEDEHARLVITHFAPEMLETQVEELTYQTDEIIEPEDSHSLVEETIHMEAEPVVAAHDISDESLSADVDVSEELPDIIRAPKIELSGLKVLGKIELPEKKKKEEVVPSEGAELPPEAKESARERRKPKRQTNQRNGRNPVSEVRERELRELEEKRKQEEERRKEQRKQSYLRTREAKVPVKKQKQVVLKRAEPAPAKKQKTEATTWLGRFMRWLTSNQ